MKVSHGADVKQTLEKYGLNHIIDYSSNVNIFHSDKIQEIYTNIDLAELALYPDIEYKQLRTKLAFKYDIPMEHIIVGNGSTELIFLIMSLESVDTVGIFHPTFSEYERAARLSNKRVVDLYYTEDFKIDVENLNCKDIDLIFVCNPNNPSGSVNNLRDLAKKCKENNTILFVDETFMDFTGETEHSLLDLIEEWDNIFVLKAVTKFYSLTGVRLGYGFSSKRIIEELWQKKEPWTINLFAEKFVDIIFDADFEKKTVHFFTEEIAWYKEELDKIKKIKVFNSKSNYFLIKSYSKSAEDLKEGMIQNHGILIRDCSNFKGLDKSFFRINIKSREENIKMLQALKKELE